MTVSNRTTDARPILRYSARVCAGLLALGVLGACDGPESVVATEDNAQPTQAPDQVSGDTPQPIDEPSPNGDDLGAIVTIDGVRIAIPDRWEFTTTSSTITAVQYTVPSADADSQQSATLTISTPIGGGLMYNLVRWDRQFRGEEATTSTWVTAAGDQQIVHFEGRGPFDTGLPGSTGIQEDTMVLGAIPIVNGPERVQLGDPDADGRYEFTIDQSSQPMRMSNVFIKLTGPTSVVESARAEWEAMIDSLEIRDVSAWATP